MDLKWNEIGVKGGERIVEAIQNNTKIKNIELTCNKLPEEMLQEIHRYLSTTIRQNLIKIIFNSKKKNWNKMF